MLTKQGGGKRVRTAMCEVSLSTPQGERLYKYNKSRAGEIPRGILGSEFKGVLCTDFYCGYNGYQGEHQRCWTHLLRDLHSLKEEYSDNRKVLEWAGKVRTLYDDAHKLLLLPPKGLGPPQDYEASTHPHNYRRRQRAYNTLVEKAAHLGRKYAQAKEHRTHPCHALCKRLLPASPRRVVPLCTGAWSFLVQQHGRA